MVKAYIDLLDQLEEKTRLIQKQDETIKRLSLKLLESENYKQEVDNDGYGDMQGNP
jgi:hypothetical protein